MAKKENRSEVTMRCSVCGFELRPVSKNKKFSVLNKFKKTINIGLVIDSSDKVFPINDEVYYCPIDLIGL